MLILFIGVMVGLVVVMTLAWAVQRHLHNCGWVDTFWTFGTGLGGVAGALIAVNDAPLSARQVITAALVGLWSLRLGLHIAVRTPGKPEDVRYARFRSEWGPKFEGRMFGLLMVQAAAAALLDLGVLIAAHNPAPGLGAHDLIGVLLLLAAVVGEGIADRQMEAFRASPDAKGRVCERGLWGWSRHPNYFFEWLGWIAYPLLAFNPHWFWGWFAWIAPALMYGLLVYISGIPPLEREMLLSRGDAFRDYQRRVSAFFPTPPKAASR